MLYHPEVGIHKDELHGVRQSSSNDNHRIIDTESGFICCQLFNVHCHNLLIREGEGKARRGRISLYTPVVGGAMRVS